MPKPSRIALSRDLIVRSNALHYVNGYGNEYQLAVFPDGSYRLWDAYTGTQPYTPEDVRPGGMLSRIIVRREDRTLRTNREALELATELLTSLY